MNNAWETAAEILAPRQMDVWESAAHLVERETSPAMVGGMSNMAPDPDADRRQVAAEGTGCGSMMGFQALPQIRKRKEKIEALLARHADLNEGHLAIFFRDMPDDESERIGGCLDRDEIDPVADEMREKIVRGIVQKKIPEIVRKKAGGGGYTLYAPNKGKKGKPKANATFPTKLGAKKSELARFPPKDPKRLQRLRREVERLMKDPKKRGEKERAEKLAVKPSAAIRKESREMVEAAIVSHEILESLIIRRIGVLAERLFKEDAPGRNEWDDHVAKLPEKVLTADKRFQSLQRGIAKKTEKVLGDAVRAISKVVPSGMKVKSHGVKMDQGTRKTFVAFSISADNVDIGPIGIYADNGIPRMELSGQAKAALTKIDPKNAKALRGELITVQERVLDNSQELTKAIGARDNYLQKLEDSVDEYVADLSPLQLSLLKTLLVKKYRKL